VQPPSTRRSEDLSVEDYALLPLMDPFSVDTLRELVHAHIGAGLATVRLQPVRTGKHNRSFWVDCDAGRFVLRIAPPDDAGFLFYERLMMRQEPALHTLIRSRTEIPAAEIVSYDFDRQTIDRDYMFMAVLPGTPISEAEWLKPPMRERALTQVGRLLRQLHGLKAPDCLGEDAYGYLGAHRPMAPQPTWWEAFRTMWRMLLADVEACGAYTPELADAMGDLLDEHRVAFERPVASALLHMDVWDQNILIDQRGNVTGLVDFDRALWGDREIEFAVLDYCGISEPAFWDGYGEERESTDGAEVRRLFYLLYEVQKYMPIEVWRRGDVERAAMYREYSLRLAAPLWSA